MFVSIKDIKNRAALESAVIQKLLILQLVTIKDLGIFYT
jgi:hypothetical protein